MNSKSNDEAMADYYAKNLASKPDKESYWSSWFFRACYISHWNKDSSQRTLGMHQSTIFDYSADEGLGARQLIEADPDKYKDQIVFVTFQDEEAPLFPGDATYAIREKGNKSFSAIPANPPGRSTGSPDSHMKVVTSDTESYGGNEGGGKDPKGKDLGGHMIGKNTIVLDSKRRLIKTQGKKYEIAVYKRVKVLGRG